MVVRVVFLLEFVGLVIRINLLFNLVKVFKVVVFVKFLSFGIDFLIIFKYIVKLFLYL